MTQEQFIYWLRGFVEAEESAYGEHPPRALVKIRKNLETVFSIGTANSVNTMPTAANLTANPQQSVSMKSANPLNYTLSYNSGN
ncbi:hypothetical protein UFOVP449_2 [uncultured Caudovirales phage]|uniref:Uncharacterized protein n=1 Tax=uncultured Caudovirales phage TaxID=2100421 RepID=A0A6J5M5H8_9CAUD|nr:hypothetical protein UFOVP449_2 [uncultured Caudovirales phage]